MTEGDLRGGVREWVSGGLGRESTAPMVNGGQDRVGEADLERLSRALTSMTQYSRELGLSAY